MNIWQISTTLCLLFSSILAMDLESSENSSRKRSGKSLKELSKSHPMLLDHPLHVIVSREHQKYHTVSSKGEPEENRLCCLQS